MKNILCYGDSNTNGTNPSGGRWGIDKRWPGILKKRLGEDYYVIEEGMGGRTTVFEDPLELYKNGRYSLNVALRTHRPLDLVIIMLGTNDMKARFSLLPQDIAFGAAELGTLVKTFAYGPGFPIPEVLLISPIELGEGVENSNFIGFAKESVEVSKQLHIYYEKHAKENGWLYLDAATVAKPSLLDKLHMEEDSHLALALAIEKIIRENI